MHRNIVNANPYQNAAVIRKIMKLSLAFAALTLLAGSARASLPCEESGYCSIGKVKPFKGDIASAEGLKAALEACSYKKEVILLTITTNVMDNAYQFYSMFLKLGLAHVMLLTPDEKTCNLALATFPDMCCVWSSLELPDEHFHFHMLLWHHRRRTAARAVRLGYNFMVLDTDMVVFDDPYKYFKKAPFKDVQLMTAIETWNYDDNALLNLGFLYVQNARVDGPVASIIAQVPDRQLRMSEDKTQTLKDNWQMAGWCGIDEQLVYDDAVYSASLGRPAFLVTSTLCTNTSVRKLPGWENYTMVEKEYLQKTRVGGGVFKMQSHPAPVEWRPLVGSETMNLKTAELRWPHFQGAWPVELGGQLLSGKRGPMSLAFQEQLKLECGNCSMWPDQEDPAALPSIAQSPTETFMFAPPWLVVQFMARGLQGLWGQHGSKPQQVIGHIHQTRADNYIGKMGIVQYLGLYDWQLAHKSKGEAVYFASTKEQPLPKLLAFMPKLPLELFATNEEEFRVVLRSLAAVAHITGRTLVLPELPCSLPWIESQPGGSSKVPLQMRDDFSARGPLGAARCTWFKFMMTGCIAGPLRSLLPWEFEHYQEAMASKDMDVRPSSLNTLTLAQPGSRRRRPQRQQQQQAMDLSGDDKEDVDRRMLLQQQQQQAGPGQDSWQEGDRNLLDPVDIEDTGVHQLGRRGLLVTQAGAGNGGGIGAGGGADAGGGAGAGAGGKPGAQSRRQRRGGGSGGQGAPFMWEADAQALLEGALKKFQDAQVLYLRRPILLTFNNQMATLERSFNDTMNACYLLKPSEGAQPSLLAKNAKKWTPTN